MTTSNSTDFTLNTREVVNEVLEYAGVLGIGQTAPTRYYTNTVRTINLMLKEWQTDGITLHLEQEFYVFLEKNQASYQLGGSGADRAVTSYTKTQISADEAGGQTTLSVESSTGMAASDVIGIELDDGTLHWTTISSVPTSTSIIVNLALASAAAEGNNVYFYDPGDVITRPVEVSSIRIRETDDNDLALVPMSRKTYYNINNKTSSSSPIKYYIDKQRDYRILSVWPLPSGVDKVLHCTGSRIVHDLDETTNNLDLPNEALSAVIFNAAKRIAIKYGRAQALSEMVSGRMSLSMMADETYRKLKRANQEYTRIKIRPRVYPD